MNEREKELRWIWTDGYDAYREAYIYGIEVTDNPHEKGTDEHRAWNEGLEAARKEYEGSD